MSWCFKCVSRRIWCGKLKSSAMTSNTKISSYDFKWICLWPWCQMHESRAIITSGSVSSYAVKCSVLRYGFKWNQTPTPTYCARVFRTCTRVDSKCARVFGISVATPAESHRLRRPSGFFLWFLSTVLAILTVYNHPCLRDLQLTENFWVREQRLCVLL